MPKAKRPASKATIRITSDGFPSGQFSIEDDDGNQLNLPVRSITWSMTSKSMAEATIVVSPVEVNVEALQDKTILKEEGSGRTMNIRDFINSQKKE